jgi:ribosomal protein L12E/L44/L45/RPP1/RPP2
MPKTRTIRISEEHYNYLLSKAKKAKNSKEVKKLLKEANIEITPVMILAAIIEKDKSGEF